MNPLEISSNIINLISVFFANRNSVHTWWTGIIGSILFGFLFFEVKLYADVTLQFFFIITGIWGWWNWIHGDNEKTVREITRISLSRLFLFTLISIAVTFGYGYLLYSLTDASFPFIDSIILIFSILAQLLLMERKLENWFFWILVDIVAVPLYSSKELYLTAFIYFIFLINAIWGLFHWLKLYRMQDEKIS